MVQKYYFDSCIWIDYLENRTDRFRPLGEWAFMLINTIIKNNGIILYSELVQEELLIRYPEENLRTRLVHPLKKILTKVKVSVGQQKEAITLSRALGIPRKDALHAILARDNGAILVTRDRHFYELTGVVVKKPEELIQENI